MSGKFEAAGAAITASLPAGAIEGGKGHGPADVALCSLLLFALAILARGLAG